YNLANKPSMRFARTGAIEDTNRAVEVADETAATTPSNHPYQASWLNSPGYWLSRRFKQTGAIEDIDCAISLAKKLWLLPLPAIFIELSTLAILRAGLAGNLSGLER